MDMGWEPSHMLIEAWWTGDFELRPDLPPSVGPMRAAMQARHQPAVCSPHAPEAS